MSLDLSRIYVMKSYDEVALVEAKSVEEASEKANESLSHVETLDSLLDYMDEADKEVLFL